MSRISWGFCIIRAAVTPEGGQNAGSVNVDSSPFPTRKLQNEARFALEACVTSVGRVYILEGRPLTSYFAFLIVLPVLSLTSFNTWNYVRNANSQAPLNEKILQLGSRNLILIKFIYLINLMIIYFMNKI